MGGINPVFPGILGAIGLMIALAAGSAQALTVSNASVGGGQGCVDASCTQQTFAWNSSSGAGSGSLTRSGGSLSFSIVLPSSTFVASPGPSDNGVTQIAFSDVTYAGSATLGGGPMLWTISGGSASVSGMQTPSGAGAAGAFAAATSLLSGSCIDTGASLICGIIFSGNDDFGFTVNDQTRWFTHTVNVTAVPEPGTALLLGGGLLLLARLGRREATARPEPRA